MTSSPGPTPSARSAISRASVPLATPMPWAVPTCSANTRSTSATRGPRMKRPESMTSPIARAICPRTAAYCEWGSIRGTVMAPTLAIRRLAGVGGDLGHRDAPGLAAGEQFVGIDVVEPAHEVPLVLSRRRSEDGLAHPPLHLVRALFGRCDPLFESRSFGIPFTHDPKRSAKYVDFYRFGARSTGRERRRALEQKRLGGLRSGQRAPRPGAVGRRLSVDLGTHRVHRRTRRRASLQPGLSAGSRVEIGRVDSERDTRELERGLGDGVGGELAGPLLHEPADCQPDDLVGGAVVQALRGGEHVRNVGGVREALARGARHALGVDAHAREYRGR